jgi:sRNA-binding protein
MRPDEDSADQTPAPSASEAAAPAPQAQPTASSDSGLSPAECGARLAALFPALFVAPDAQAPVKPIKLRIHADILARAPGVFSKRVLGIFFSRYTTSNAYLKALTAPGAQRFDLDGEPAGEIADEHRAAAVEELARRHAIAAERRAAQRRAAAPQPPHPSDGAPRPPRERDPREHVAGQRREPRRRGHDAAAQRPPRERAAAPAQHANRPAPGPRPAPPRHDAPAPAPALPIDPAQRERALLLRAYENSTLSKANFCALKRISEAELDALLAQAAGERRGATASKS